MFVQLDRFPKEDVVGQILNHCSDRHYRRSDYSPDVLRHWAMSEDVDCYQGQALAAELLEYRKRLLALILSVTVKVLKKKKESGLA